MKNTEYRVLWILTHTAFNCNKFFDLGHFSKFEDGIERKLDKLHFHIRGLLIGVHITKHQPRLLKEGESASFVKIQVCLPFFGHSHRLWFMRVSRKGRWNLILHIASTFPYLFALVMKNCMLLL